NVTGVQTCALPILHLVVEDGRGDRDHHVDDVSGEVAGDEGGVVGLGGDTGLPTGHVGAVGGPVSGGECGEVGGGGGTVPVEAGRGRRGDGKGGEPEQEAQGHPPDGG